MGDAPQRGTPRETRNRSTALFDDTPHHECGVFAIYVPDEDVARLTFIGLYARQHRGSGSAAIANGRRVNFYNQGKGVKGCGGTGFTPCDLQSARAYRERDHMDSEARQNLEEQLAIHKRNLHALEMQKAQHGITPPVSVLNGIALERDAIAEIETQLAPGAAPTAAPAEPPAAGAARAGVGLDYELGLQSLKAALPDTARGDFLLFEARLRENLSVGQRYGSTEAVRAERAQIVDELNQLALSSCSRRSAALRCRRASLRRWPAWGWNKCNSRWRPCAATMCSRRATICMATPSS